MQMVLGLLMFVLVKDGPAKELGAVTFIERVWDQDGRVSPPNGD